MARRSNRTSDSNESVVGRTGRVTGTVGPGLVGEVVIAIRGGSEAFNAYPYLGTDTIALGAQVVVMEYAQPRIAYVSPLDQIGSPQG